MNILITGNMGYVGSALVPYLRMTSPGLRLIGLDLGWFHKNLVAEIQPPESHLDWQLNGDVRTPPQDLFLGIDAVVHLAAVSNDPIGKRFEAVTQGINEIGTIRLAHLAKSAGVKRFVFASSCSMYGAGGDRPKDERSELAPQTAYARSKVAAERALLDLGDPGFSVRSLRFSTACGSSPRPRLDLVLNDFVATARETGVIKVLSDGSPWRPLIHVHDMCRAIAWAISDRNGGSYAVNVGSDAMNYQVKDLAEAVARKTGATVEINKDAAPDTRSYRVDFSLWRTVAPSHQPMINLDTAIDDLVDSFQRFRPDLTNFRNRPQFIRLHQLVEHIEQGRMDEQLNWRAQ